MKGDDLRWRTHGTRTVHLSHWLQLDIVDVELPDGTRLEHEVPRSPRHGVATVVHDAERGILLLHRHRFIADRWDWELPGGMVEESERVEVAGAREVEEETGWRPASVRRLTSFHPSSGWSDQTFHLCWAEGAMQIGPPTERNEAAAVAWHPVDEVAGLLRRGEVADGLTQFGLAIALAGSGGVSLFAGGPWSDLA
jgi:8-oxo-dGDP phosphatase